MVRFRNEVTKRSLGLDTGHAPYFVAIPELAFSLCRGLADSRCRARPLALPQHCQESGVNCSLRPLLARGARHPNAEKSDYTTLS